MKYVAFDIFVMKKKRGENKNFERNGSVDNKKLKI